MTQPATCAAQPRPSLTLFAINSIIGASCIKGTRLMDQVAQTVLLVLVSVIMGWFALGTVWNIRHGNAVLRWMQAGLPKLGERTTLRWLGSAAVDLGIAKARAPFRQAQLLLVLEPRDVPWFWIIAHARGRRDMLIVRGQLLSAPQYEFDLLAPGSWSESERSGRADARQ